MTTKAEAFRSERQRSGSKKAKTSPKARARRSIAKAK
jgi:hypothetical protein